MLRKTNLVNFGSAILDLIALFFPSLKETDTNKKLCPNCKRSWLVLIQQGNDARYCTSCNWGEKIINI
jgi:hypothetical protein